MNEYANKIIKIICFVFGSIFLILGVVGVMLPILPGIPFLIIAILLFSAGMTRKKRKEFKKEIKRQVKKEVDGVGKVAKKVVGLN